MLAASVFLHFVFISVNDMADFLTRQGAPVYKYYFNIVNGQPGWPKWMGCLRGDEISYFFGIPLRRDSTFSAMDQMVSAAMMHDLGTFAKNG